jgi:CII-binding regulator of phage lambda lysogenization HflD
MFDMQKWAAIEERKKYLEAKQRRKHEAKNVISSVENFYKDKISQLKERLSEERASRKEAE